MVVLIEAGTTAPGSIIIGNARSPISNIELGDLGSAPDLLFNSHAHGELDRLQPLDPKEIVFEAPQTSYDEMRGAASEVLRNMGFKDPIDREKMLGSFDRLREGDKEAVAVFQATLTDFQDGVVNPVLAGLRKAAEFIDEEALPLLTSAGVLIGAGMAGYLAADFILRSHRSLITKYPQARKSLGGLKHTVTLIAGLGGMLAGCTGMVWATTTASTETPTALPAPVIRVTHNPSPTVDLQPSATVPPEAEKTPRPEEVEVITAADYNAEALLDTIPAEDHKGDIIPLDRMTRVADRRDTLTGWSRDEAIAKLAEMQSVLDNSNPELVKDEAIFAKAVYLVLLKDGVNNFIILVNDTVPKGTIAGDTLWHSAIRDEAGNVILNFQPNASMGLGVKRFGNWVGPGVIDGQETFLKAVDLTPVGGIKGLLDGRGGIVFDGNGIAYLVALDAQGKVVQVFDAVSGTWLESETASIPEPMATPTPEAVFVPEGFEIGELGLLRNPETGKDVLTLNPEADWARVREEIIGGLWQANVDWANFTGQTNDAVNYTKDAFIAAALQGKQFHIGIPVRLDGTSISESDRGHQRNKDQYVILQMVDGVSLDNIQIQVLTPDAFVTNTGLGWMANKQQAIDCASYPGTAANVCLFSTDGNKNLTISVGNFNLEGEVVTSKHLLIGRFDPALAEKYPTYFRPDGIGVEADTAANFTLKFVIDELNRFPTASHTFTGADGRTVKVFNVGLLKDRFFDEIFYSKPHLFIFSE